VDQADPAPEPALVGFIPSHQDTRPGEGLQVVEIITASFSGDVLIVQSCVQQ
jgi:hypothetical protein